MGKSIIIIGGGLTGLSAGCYGRMNGYGTTIFEMHSIAGGVATAWTRKGYTIDGAMNWLMGTKPETGYHRIWEELGAAPGWRIYNHDRFSIHEDRNGRAFHVYCDADSFERYLLQIAPEDGGIIRELTRTIRSVDFDWPVGKPAELNNVLDRIGMIRMIPLGMIMRRWGKVTAQQFAQRFKSPFLREMIPLAFSSEVPFVVALFLLALQHHRLAGYVIGGARALVEPIQRRYEGLGGEIRFGARVEKILVEHDRAVGIRLTDGTEHHADWVVSTADGRTTIFDMLEGRYIDRELKSRYENPDLFAPLVYVALGVNRSFEDAPASLIGTNFPLDAPILIAGKKEDRLNVLVYAFDPTLSPAGRTVLVVSFTTDYDYWKNLSQEPERYRAEKERVCSDVIAGLEQRFPVIADQIEMRDVATPITWERYTGNWRGAYEGWQFGGNPFAAGMKKTLPGLGGFYMAGQWVNPGGGMPTAVVSGNHTIQLICRRDRKQFVTTRP